MIFIRSLCVSSFKVASATFFLYSGAGIHLAVPVVYSRRKGKARFSGKGGFWVAGNIDEAEGKALT